MIKEPSPKYMHFFRTQNEMCNNYYFKQSKHHYKQVTKYIMIYIYIECGNKHTNTDKTKKHKIINMVVDFHFVSMGTSLQPLFL